MEKFTERTKKFIQKLQQEGWTEHKKDLINDNEDLRETYPYKEAVSLVAPSKSYYLNIWSMDQNTMYVIDGDSTHLSGINDILIPHYDCTEKLLAYKGRIEDCIAEMLLVDKL